MRKGLGLSLRLPCEGAGIAYGNILQSKSACDKMKPRERGVKMSRQEREKNLIVVAAAEEYGLRYHMPVKDVLYLFAQHHVAELLRSQYEVLHMMDLSEGADFAESVLHEAVS